MRRGWTLITLGAIAMASIPVIAPSADAEIVSVLPCAPSAVQITEYNTLAGAGHVNDLFWIRNVSAATCSLRGYVRASYLGKYGTPPPSGPARPLAVGQSDTRGGAASGSYVGGLGEGLSISTVALKPQQLGSFWIDGLDESVTLENGTPTRCITSTKLLIRLPGSATPIDVSLRRGSGFYWCGGTEVHPIVGGRSGSDPPRALSFYFGAPS
jgi:hypothetical protein